MKVNNKCPFCNSGDSFIFHNKIYDKEYPNVKVYKCNVCGFVYLYPFLTEKQFQKLYINYEKMYNKRESFVIKNSDDIFRHELEDAEIRYNRWFEYINNKNILEIGSSYGAFLSLCRKACKTFNCVEKNKKAINYVKEHFLVNSFNNLEDVSDKIKDKTDVIFGFHVFEHLLKPLDLLDEIKSFGKDKIIIFEIPSIDDPLISIYNIKKFKDFYFQIQHPYYYSDVLLESTFEAAEIEVEDIIYHQRYGFDNHMKWLCGKLGNANFKEFAELFSDVYVKYLENNKMTDTITIIGRT